MHRHSLSNSSLLPDAQSGLSVPTEKIKAVAADAKA